VGGPPAPALGVVVVAALIVASTIVLLAVVGLNNEQRAHARWEMVLSAKGYQAFATLRQRFLAEQEAAQATYEDALQARERSTEEALRLLEIGYGFLAYTTADRMALLKKLSLYSRLVFAMEPLPPVRPHAFQLRSLSRIAGLAGLLHHLLVATTERFRLRLFVLRRGFPMALRALLQSGRGIGSASEDGAWEQLLAARDDISALDGETLESARVLLTALAAQA
jgi:hypothetical protein